MQDPSFGVNHALLPHVHLVSTYQFPLTPTPIGQENVVEYLLQASRIVRTLKPMAWQYLQTPPDGTVLLTWQPSAQRGSVFSSDGYFWLDPESQYQTEARGYLVEVLVHNSGFKFNEGVATHARHRYRLLQKVNPNMDGPPADPSLWIVHYCQNEPQNRLAVQRNSLNRDHHAVASERRYLEQQGDLMRKEFMLHDRANWPQLPMPNAAAAGRMRAGPGMQPGFHPAGVIPPGMGLQPRPGLPPYPYHPGPTSGPVGGTAPPPAKRARQQPPQQPSMHAEAIAADPHAFDEEDTSLGDIMDHMTPREISIMRYQQHHEWMDEIVNSPYHINSIKPIDLGLGLAGELKFITEGISDAPKVDFDGNAKAKPGPGYKPITSNDYAEFEKRVNEFLEKANSEMDKMREQQQQALGDLQRAKAYQKAEERLARFDMDGEFDRVAARFGIYDLPRAYSTGKAKHTGPAEKADDILKDLEAELNAKPVSDPEVKIVKPGGLQEMHPLYSTFFPAATNVSGRPMKDRIQNVLQRRKSPSVGPTNGSLLGVPSPAGLMSGMTSEAQSQMGTPAAAAGSMGTDQHSLPQPLQYQQDNGTPADLDHGDQLLDANDNSMMDLLHEDMDLDIGDLGGHDDDGETHHHMGDHDLHLPPSQPHEEHHAPSQMEGSAPPQQMAQTSREPTQPVSPPPHEHQHEPGNADPLNPSATDPSNSHPELQHQQQQQGGQAPQEHMDIHDHDPPAMDFDPTDFDNLEDIHGADHDLLDFGDHDDLAGHEDAGGDSVGHGDVLGDAGVRIGDEAVGNEDPTADPVGPEGNTGVGEQGVGLLRGGDVLQEGVGGQGEGGVEAGVGGGQGQAGEMGAGDGGVGELDLDLDVDVGGDAFGEAFEGHEGS